MHLEIPKGVLPNEKLEQFIVFCEMSTPFDVTRTTSSYILRQDLQDLDEEDVRDVMQGNVDLITSFLDVPVILVD